MDSDKSRKHNSSLKESNNKPSKLKSKEMKISPSKNSAHSKIVTSSPKQKLHKEKNGNSKGDLEICDEHDDKISKQFNNLRNNSSMSTSEEDKDTEKSSSRKKTKIDLFDERIEKKKQRAIMYEKYLQRGGARNPGSKEIPTVRNFP